MARDRPGAIRRQEARARYAENRRAALTAALKKQLVGEALEFGLASAETAFVATREEPGKPVEQTVVVANALGAGWSGDLLISPLMLPPSLSAAGLPASAGLRSAAIPSPPPGDVFGSADFEVDALYSGSECFAMDDEDDMSATAPSLPGSDLAVVYAGVPALAGGEAVLFDSTHQPKVLPSSVTLTRLLLRWPDAPATIDTGLSLKVYVDDLATPRALVRLADLAKLGGQRPLNLVVRPGQVVRIVLADPAGAWSAAAPRMEVSLGW